IPLVAGQAAQTTRTCRATGIVPAPGACPLGGGFSFEEPAMAKAKQTAADVTNDGAAAQAPPKDPQATDPTPGTEPEQGRADLVGLAQQLEALAAEATRLGEETVAKKIGRAANSARHALKAGAARRRRVGKVVEQLQKQGLTAEQIVAELTKAG